MLFCMVRNHVVEYIDGSNLLIVLDILALLGVIFLANAFAYKVLPDVKIAWRDVWPGSIAATLLMALEGW